MEMCRQGQALRPDSEVRSRQGSSGLLSAPGREVEVGRERFAPGERGGCGCQRLELLDVLAHQCMTQERATKALQLQDYWECFWNFPALSRISHCLAL